MSKGTSTDGAVVSEGTNVGANRGASTQGSWCQKALMQVGPWCQKALKQMGPCCQKALMKVGPWCHIVTLTEGANTRGVLVSKGTNAGAFLVQATLTALWTGRPQCGRPGCRPRSRVAGRVACAASP